MAIEVITKEDLQEFRVQLLEDIRRLLSPPEAKLVKPWLKNLEVRKLLGISSNTLQRLRIAGKLRSSKVGGVHYYRYEDIEKLLNSDAA
ncbi:MAG: helix-turn-helix domain-containing protein [Sphingobacteriales bacterium]|nr:helix-turn-helix domain-containing protein [Sphingobacteriales bacterium]OJW01292.1 MAG: DNA-binding protein [Sphingobacteriales bacterium 44-61]